MAWKDFFAPVACGERFEVVPPWLKEEADPGRTCIVIEPKMAFGTGHHATTALCLELIGGIRGNGDLSALRFLDLGTGSGILAIGLAMLGLTGLGLDIDPEAIPCAVENAEANGVADRIAFSVGELACLAPGLTFDVIAANILSGPLIELAESIAARLAPGGLLLLSGILTEQADAVAEAYVRAGLPEPERFPREEWCALRIRRPA
jgi:ribosomal protein L11 methyltransferase